MAPNSGLQVLGIGPYTAIFCNEMPEDPWGPSDHYCVGYCIELDVDVYRIYWDENGYNHWEGAIRSEGVGTIAYAPGVGDTGLWGTYNQIAGYFAPYSWIYEDPFDPGVYYDVPENYTVTGDGECGEHSNYWGIYDD